MFNSRFFRLRYFAVLLLALIFAVSAYAFANANTVPTSGAGDGEGDISGYDITSVTYDTNTDSNPGTIDMVSFDMTSKTGAGAATEVFVKLDASSNAWYPCTAGTAPRWNCTITGVVNTADADELRVVAVQ